MTDPLVTPAETAAASSTLDALIKQDVPWFEQGAITPQIRAAVVTAILHAAAIARAKAKTP